MRFFLSLFILISGMAYGQSEELIHDTQSPRKGFRLRKIEPGSIYERVGLKPGDVIKKWNGHEINKPDDMSYITDSLTQAAKITVVIERNGKEEVFYYTIK